MQYLDINKLKIVCQQCGGNDFKSIDQSLIECAYCGTQIDTTITLTDNTTQHMQITNGADVEIKDNATVKIKGGLEIKGGKLTIKDGGSLEIG